MEQYSDEYIKGFLDASKEIFAKFDEYSCIKDDQWYNNYKDFKLNGFKTVLVKGD